MPLYQYEAVSDKGKQVSGSIDADSLLDAKQKLVPVSYTHLDVYKRQERNMVRRLY